MKVKKLPLANWQWKDVTGSRGACSCGGAVEATNKWLWNSAQWNGTVMVADEQGGQRTRRLSDNNLSFAASGILPQHNRCTVQRSHHRSIIQVRYCFSAILLSSLLVYSRFIFQAEWATFTPTASTTLWYELKPRSTKCTEGTKHKEPSTGDIKTHERPFTEARRAWCAQLVQETKGKSRSNKGNRTKNTR